MFTRDLCGWCFFFFKKNCLSVFNNKKSTKKKEKKIITKDYFRKGLNPPFGNKSSQKSKQNKVFMYFKINLMMVKYRMVSPFGVNCTVYVGSRKKKEKKKA